MRTTEDRTIVRGVRTLTIGPRRTLTAEAELKQLAGNARPYFAVTGEERNTRKRGDNQVEACGCLHEEIAHTFPELIPVIALHLADDRGVPMYAVENGAYWLGLGDPRYLPADAPRMDYFAKLWRVDDVKARELYDYARRDDHPREALTFLAKLEGERWQREADEAVRIIKRFGRP